jgi:acetamidase/formamidase
MLTSDLPPVVHIKSGQTARIETLSHGGLNEDPVKAFAAAGIPASEVLPDLVAVYHKSTATPGFGGHVLTGPIYIDGAEPGDMLEVRMIKLEPRVPYGVNNPGPGGVAPGLVAAREQKIIKYDEKRSVALFANGIEVPLHPFLGIMAVAPPTSMGARISSKAPGVYGGNMDFKALSQGSTLYLPVFQPGALFVTGDSHTAQGDGEVDGNALEASLNVTLQFVVHKGAGKSMRFPRAEDADNYYVMGIDPDLNVALKDAVEETSDFLKANKGLSAGDAYSLSSVAVDYGVAEAVDQNLVIYGRISKGLFKDKTPYWLKH